MSNCYFVLEKEKPKFQKLRNLLEMNLYLGPAMDRNNDAKKYDIESLLNIVQASEEEIFDHLNYIEAYQIDGYWRLLSREYQNEMIDIVLKLIDEKSWFIHEIPVNEIYEELREIIPLYVLKRALKLASCGFSSWFLHVFKVNSQTVCWLLFQEKSG